MRKKVIFPQKIYGCFLLFAVLLLLGACAPSAAVLYENYFDELDIENRCNDAAAALDAGHITLWLKGEIRAIVKDLRSIPTGDPMLTEINDTFIRSANLLMDCYEAQQTGDLYAADKAFTTAKVEYANANNALNAYKRQLSQEDSV